MPILFDPFDLFDLFDSLPFPHERMPGPEVVPGFLSLFPVSGARRFDDREQLLARLLNSREQQRRQDADDRNDDEGLNQREPLAPAEPRYLDTHERPCLNQSIRLHRIYKTP